MRVLTCCSAFRLGTRVSGLSHQAELRPATGATLPAELRAHALTAELEQLRLVEQRAAARVDRRQAADGVNDQQGVPYLNSKKSF